MLHSGSSGSVNYDLPVAGYGTTGWELYFLVEDGDFTTGDSLTVSNIQLTQTMVPIPEPPVLLLIAAGLLGLHISRAKNA